MAGTDPTGSPLEATARSTDPHATEAFALLGDETRLAILLALWEAHDPFGDDDGVPFSRLFERVDYDDRGNFSYHLEKLQGQFVRQRGERGGYELGMPGLKLVRAVVAGAGVQEVTLAPAEIDWPCPFCDAATTVSYREGLVFWSCTECAGVTPDVWETDGPLSVVPFEPAGLTDRTPEQLRTASMAALFRQARSLFDGLCPTCSGQVDGWLECCPDHDPDGVCGDCGLRFGVQACFQCRTCRDVGVTMPSRLALFHPAVVAFYDRHGVSTRVTADDFERAKRVYALLSDHEEVLLSRDPPRVAVTVALDGDEVQLTFDETASVVDVSR